MTVRTYGVGGECSQEHGIEAFVESGGSFLSQQRSQDVQQTAVLPVRSCTHTRIRLTVSVCVPMCFVSLTRLEVGLEDVRREGDGPVQDPGNAAGQEDVGSAELSDTDTHTHKNTKRI